MLQTGGSVGTTSTARAMSAGAAFGRHWRLAYSPQLPSPQLDLLPALDAMLACFLGLALLLASIAHLPSSIAVLVANRLPPLNELHVAAARINAAGLAASVSRRAAMLETSGESGAIAGLIAGGLSCSGYSSSSVAAIAAGMMSGLLCRRTLAQALYCGLPATAASVYTVGCSGVLAGLVGALLAPLTAAASDWIRSLTAVLPLMQPPFNFSLGAIVGVMVKLGSIHGYYHAVMLPLILLEMEVKA